MSRRHSQPVRGLMPAKTSQLFQGRFGRNDVSFIAQIWRENESNLPRLGQSMCPSLTLRKAEKTTRESGIPALHTYLGQFIDHDITFDPASRLQRTK